MKIAAAIRTAWASGESVVGLEFFAPSSSAGVEKLLARVHRMTVALTPTYVSLSHAGGLPEFLANVELASQVQRVSSVAALLHLSVTNMGKAEVAKALDAAKAAGVCNVLAVRGDPNDGDATWKPTCDDPIATAAELVALIRQLHGDFFCVGVGGHPELFDDSAATSEDASMGHLLAKVNAGADFVVAEFVFDAESFITWRKAAEGAGVECPIIAALLPIQSHSSFTRLARRCKIRIPAAVSTSVALIMHDQSRVRDYGVSLGISMLKQLADAFPGGLAAHIVTLNLEVVTRRTLIGVGVACEDGAGNRRKLPWRSSGHARREGEGVRPIFWANRPQSYIERTASWDKFPDTRWGGVNNPCYSTVSEGVLEGSRCGSADERRSMWGDCPIEERDVFEVFAHYVQGEIRCLPWCDTQLAKETSTIVRRLAAINRFGFLTINSQPRVNGLPSDDPVFGWGGPGGYVYQKAYVECFTSPTRLAKLMQAVERFPSVTYTAVDVRGNTYTNAKRRGVNAVTWGVFPSKEVLQPTVVDHESFLAWKDEAFALWRERWAPLYEEGSDSHSLVHDIHDSYFLVYLVDNDFIKGDVFAVFDEVIRTSPASNKLNGHAGSAAASGNASAAGAGAGAGAGGTAAASGPSFKTASAAKTLVA